MNLLESTRIELFHVGKAVIQRRPNAFYELLLVQNRKKQLQNQVWQLNMGLYGFKNWSYVFCLIKSASCVSLQMGQNSEPLLLREISHISFSKLRVLALASNRIFQIETLSFLDVEKLQILDLKDNLIAGLKPLNKCIFPCMIDCDLGKNPYVEIDFSRTKMKYPDDLDLNRQGHKKGFASITASRRIQVFYTMNQGLLSQIETYNYNYYIQQNHF